MKKYFSVIFNNLTALKNTRKMEKVLEKLEEFCQSDDVAVLTCRWYMQIKYEVKMT